MAIVALLACVAPACSVGFGSAYVGQWREREQVDYEICVEDETGQCRTREPVTSHIPARRFWGMNITYPGIGMAFTSIDDVSDRAFRLELASEFLRGKGRFALGVRAGATIDLFGAGEGAGSMVSAPVMLLGHAGLSERFSFYGGAGYLPISRFHPGDDEAGATSTTSHLGFRALGGVQMVLSRSHRDNRIVWAVEADHMWIDLGDRSLRSNGVVTHIGISM